eukprot:TRINITY_DN6746_c0_g1_i1.p1 TRINITY_DN6746_c0_g1~~TRINITY_DN6746_c0_g1_i1.p1  ORF type:complete len:349 (-),score=22.88 TRINITY_DN6746_c0_g1_i1:21-1067(-)
MMMFSSISLRKIAKGTPIKTFNGHASKGHHLMHANALASRGVAWTALRRPPAAGAHCSRGPGAPAPLALRGAEVRVWKRFYPALEENQVDEMWERIKHDKENIRYVDLPVERKRWMRRVNTVTAAFVLTTAVSALVVSPLVLKFWEPDFATAMCFGAIAGIFSPEALRIASDQGLDKSIPLLLLFPLAFLGIPSSYLYYYYPVYFVKGCMVGLAAFLSNLYFSFYGLQKYTPTELVVPSIVASVVMSLLVYPFPFSLPYSQLLGLVGCTALFTYFNHFVFQRNLKFAKHSPLVDDLDERLPHAVLLLLLGPVLILIALIIAYNYDHEVWAQKEEVEAQQEQPRRRREF